MEVAQFFIVIIGWIIFPISTLALLWATFIVFRQDLSALHWGHKRLTLLSR